jgi:hypothetical protein
MFKLANQFSFLFLIVPVVALVLFYLLRGQGSRFKQALAVLLVAAVTISFFWLQPGTNAVSGEETENFLETATTPVLLEIYSDF